MKLKQTIKINYMLSSLKANDINHLLWELEHIYLNYRPTLNLNDDIKFGIELEYENALQSTINDSLNKLYKENKLTSQETLWISDDDSSVHTEIDNKKYGGEVKSPILKDTKESWEELQTICDMIKNNEGTTTKRTSTHIHIDQGILGNDTKNWLNFIKLWIIYEEIIYRFCYGEYSTSRPNIIKYSYPVRAKYLNDIKNYGLDKCEDLDTLIIRLKKGKYYGINFMNTNTSYSNHQKNTIEFRTLNGTLEPIIIQNTILLYTKILEAAKSIPESYLNAKIASLNIYKEQDFDNYYVYEAIELADLIFDNIYDKLCFLKQYIKSFNYSENFEKSPIFINKF